MIKDSEAKSQSSKEQLQQKYLEFQFLQQQIEQASQQLENLTQQLQEMEVSKEALIQLEKTKKETELLATIAPGIFLEATLKDNQKLIVNVGANTVVEKTVQQVIRMLETQKKSLQEVLAKSEAVLEALSQQAMGIYQELEKAQR